MESFIFKTKRKETMLHLKRQKFAGKNRLFQDRFVMHFHC